MNAAEEFHSGNGNRSRGKALEAEHGSGSGLDATMILLNEIVQVFRRAQRCPLRHQSPYFHISSNGGKLSSPTEVCNGIVRMKEQSKRRT
jgi:hypothetical protein